MNVDPPASELSISREVRGHVLLVGLNRPRVKNAFDLAMIRSLSAALTELDRDPELRCGVIFSTSKDFTSGLDLANVAPALTKAEPLFDEDMVDPWGTQGQRCSKPIVVAVRGLCFTAGVELLLNGDVCVAGSDARFAQLEVSRGILPVGGGVARWVERTGWGNAMRWLLTGDTLDAAEALRIGLVQEVVDPERVLARAIELAERIAAQAPLAVAATLRNARTALGRGEAEAFEEMWPELRALMTSEDAREGMLSFMERRAGRFRGR